jgi:prephenate dehydrogenase
MKPKTIAIIGGTGKMGALFADAFRKQNYDVLIAGRKTPLSPIDAASRADVVIITVPIRNTEETIRMIGPYVRSDALLTDFTSIKVMPAKAMMRYSKAEVIAGHPLFGPSVSFKGQHFILYPMRGKSYVTWYKRFLTSLGMHVLLMTPDEHDRNMAVIQSLTHMTSIAHMHACKRLGYDIAGQKMLASPSYLLSTYSAGRILAQNPLLYADISIHNPYTKKVAAAYKASVDALTTSVREDDTRSFERIFKRAQEHLGSFCETSMRVTNRLISAMVDSSLHKHQKK